MTEVPLIEIEGLRVIFHGDDGRETHAVDSVDLSVANGATLGLVGESGCGKSVTSLAIMGLLSKHSAEVTGSVRFDGFDLLEVPDQTLRDLRGNRLAMIFQEPMTSLNPSFTIGDQIIETILRHRGGSRRQARENLKKLRGLVRRAQNHGYATLSRIADHLERLAVGDESNAAIDAIDAVSLMTVHAAKGLEFPIVFVVNMGRGTGGPRAPIRVTDDAAGEASVAIADYQSEADEDQSAREREESKRLLYVALTRARERLYLSATVKDGGCRMGRGSLGEVLPAGVRARFVAAAAAGLHGP